MYVYVWGYRAIYPRSLYEILRDKKARSTEARTTRADEKEGGKRGTPEEEVREATNPQMHTCIYTDREYMRECVRACVHDEEPYAPQARIRTEMAAITVAERWHERDGHIHHPRSFEYRGAERRTRRDDKRERVGGKMEGKDRRLRREGRNER